MTNKSLLNTLAHSESTAIQNAIPSTNNIGTANVRRFPNVLLLPLLALMTILFCNNAVAQLDTAIEVVNWGKYIMIGKNDSYYTASDQYIMTFGQGATGNNVGLWGISGGYNKGFFIGRTHNTTKPNTYGQTSGQWLINVDSNMNIGIDKWSHLIEYKLDVAGQIRATREIYGLNFLIQSDGRYKKSIKPLGNVSDLFKVNSVQYKPSSEALREQLEYFKQENQDMEETKFNAIVASYEKDIKLKDADTSTHFGFIAQELREIYPNLVYEDKQGYLSVNYIEMIPILVDAIKELKAEINELKGGFDKPNVADLVNNAKLYQNNPNPFTNNTEIKYFIPNNSENASICIYDMLGGQIMKIDLTIRGYSSITLHGNQLKPGMYFYALLVDGKEIDTKKMFLTDK